MGMDEEGVGRWGRDESAKTRGDCKVGLTKSINYIVINSGVDNFFEKK